MENTFHVGDRVQGLPSVNINSGKLSGTVIFADPKGRYCTVQFDAGYCESFRLSPYTGSLYKGEELSPIIPAKKAS